MIISLHCKGGAAEKEKEGLILSRGTRNTAARLDLKGLETPSSEEDERYT